MNKRIALVVVVLVAVSAMLGATFLILRSLGSKSTTPLPNSTPPVVLKDVKPETEIIVSDLSNPWDVQFLPNGDMLFTQRGKGLFFAAKSATHSGFAEPREIYRPDDLYASGEGGMLGLGISRNFSESREVFACFNVLINGSYSVRLARLTLSDNLSRVENRVDILTGLPAISSGRHSGCRLAVDANNNIWIGTGDSAQFHTPQSKTVLGGKILRIDRTGRGVPGNLTTPFDDRIFSYGHRNTQGLVLFPEPISGSFGFSAEHGPNKDDEINLLVPGNFGWDPKPGYDELVPMTDRSKYPDAISSIWASGDPTVATAGLLLVQGQQWGPWEGSLLMATLKDQYIKAFSVSGGTKLTEFGVFLNGFGRIRSLTQGPDGNIYFTTDNGSGQDKIVKVYPQSD